MKTLFFCLGLCFLFAFSSCTTTEEIWINTDGSLRSEWKMDMGALVPFMKMADEMEETEEAETEPSLIGEPPPPPPPPVIEEVPDEITLEEEDYAILEEEEGNPVENAFTEMLKRDNVDTLISFRSILEEAMKEKGVSEDQIWQALAEADEEELSGEDKEAVGSLLKTLINTQIRIKMSEAESVYFFSLIQDFESAEDLTAGQNALEMLQKITQEENEERDPTQDAMLQMMTGQNPTYSLKKKEFRISRPAADMSKMTDEAQESMQMMQMFMGAMEYEYVIHFPKKVKKVNLKDAEIIDGKTVRIKAPMPQVGQKNEAFELVVKFK